MEEVLDITLHLAQTFDRLGIPYLVGGSLASSLHGIPRATQDVDILAAMQLRHVAPLVAALEKAFYVDETMIREAVRHRSSFNIIHLETMFKVDVFLAKDDPVSRRELQRRRSYVVSDTPRRTLVIASPEDIIAQKLYWYRLGAGVSDRQWSDVQGVMKVQGALLDMAYLRQIASLMNVTDLLQRAAEEAGLPWKDEPDARSES